MLDWAFVSDTVLIASPERLRVLESRDELVSAATFHDSDVLAALDVITRDRPRLIALDRQFADSSRGAALVTRIKVDPSLNTCEIRIVGDSPLPAAPDVVMPSPRTPDPAAPVVDRHGTRRAVRVAMRAGMTVALDGNPVTLVDLSVQGAQVLSPLTMRPNQKVRVTLPDQPRPLRLNAWVKWAKFEMPKEGARFRAGLLFEGAEPGILDRFIDDHRA
jgi:hypothetical protein